ncbi:MAG: GNAT family N-acetyltransferase [Bacteroidia bacterium]|nr:GNAT family N-acetyltransferase [Bacteroidia bacterium]
MQPIKLKAAGTEDLETVAALARLIWNQHYPSIIGQKQIDYMLGKMYNRESLLEQIQVKHHRFYLVEACEKTIGFVSLHQEDKNNWFIPKFYIDQTIAGKGYGTMVFKELLQLTRANCFRLTVNRQNFKAINFYFKLGFKIEKVADFDIGDGYVMNDFVMVWLKV